MIPLGLHTVLWVMKSHRYQPQGLLQGGGTDGENKATTSAKERPRVQVVGGERSSIGGFKTCVLGRRKCKKKNKPVDLGPKPISG
jgi:hypothetical protein